MLTRHFITALVALSVWLCGATAELQIPTCPSTTTTLPPQYHHSHKPQRVKTTYGHFTTPSVSDNHGMGGFQCAPPLPCTSCSMTFMQAGLAYPDGTAATVDTGMMFHHVVFQNLERKDAMCADGRERFFASGDERTAVDLSVNGTREYGYVVEEGDRFAFWLEVMNMRDVEREVVLTMVWEWVDVEEGFEGVTPYWFDVGGCEGSEVPAREGEVFTYLSERVKAPGSGVVAMAAGHLHDGGTELEVMRNEKPFCTSRAGYEKEHIAEMSTCSALEYSRGDSFKIRGRYDTKKHKPMQHADRELEPVMGIALVYAVTDHSGKSGEMGVWKIVLVVLLSMVVAAGVGYAWWRYQRKEGDELVPAWAEKANGKKRLGRSRWKWKT